MFSNGFNAVCYYVFKARRGVSKNPSYISVFAKLVHYFSKNAPLKMFEKEI